MTQYSFFAYNNTHAQEWDDFVTHHPQGSIHQISNWKPFQEQIPGRGNVLGFGAKDTKDNIIGTCFCVRMSTGIHNTYWWYSARGPVIDPKHRESTEAFLNYIKEHLQETEGIFWRIDPYFTDEEYQNIHQNWNPATQNYQPEHTLVLDLTKDDETLLKEMKRKGRYNIKQAQKHGVTIRSVVGKEVTENDLDIFWSLTTATTERDGFSGHDKEYYRHFLNKLSPHSVLFIAEKDGTPLASAINTHVGTKAIYYFGASTSNRDLRKCMAPYLLQWEMIQYAREQGCKTYDFLGIAPENKPKHPYAGISDFKWKFGGNRTIYASGKEIVLRPWLYRGYKFLKRLR